MLTVAAWYDIFLGGSLRNYVGVKLHGGSDAARRGQRLLVTIGGHAGSGPKIGDVDFGPSANFEENEVILSWYDHLFKNAANEFCHSRTSENFRDGRKSVAQRGGLASTPDPAGAIFSCTREEKQTR